MPGRTCSPICYVNVAQTIAACQGLSSYLLASRAFSQLYEVKGVTRMTFLSLTSATVAILFMPPSRSGQARATVSATVCMTPLHGIEVVAGVLAGPGNDSCYRVCRGGGVRS